MATTRDIAAPPGRVLADGVNLGVAGRELTVVAGGGSADLVLDVTGSWL